MKTIHQAVQNYQQQLQNLSKAKQIILLYDGLLKHVSIAQNAEQEQNIQQKFDALERAKAIVDGLQDSLDSTAGEDIAGILNRFYQDIQFRLILLQNQKGDADYQYLANDLTEMRDSWRKALSDNGN